VHNKDDTKLLCVKTKKKEQKKEKKEKKPFLKFFEEETKFF
jgi:hypothetical protein